MTARTKIYEGDAANATRVVVLVGKDVRVTSYYEKTDERVFSFVSDVAAAIAFAYVDVFCEHGAHAKLFLESAQEHIT